MRFHNGLIEITFALSSTQQKKQRNTSVSCNCPKSFAPGLFYFSVHLFHLHGPQVHPNPFAYADNVDSKSQNHNL